MAETKSTLFTEFPPVSDTDWESVVHADLKGKDYEKTLVWKTYEGFEVKPYYRKSDLQGIGTDNSVPGEFPFIRGNKAGNDWLIRQDIFVSDFEAANKKALALLNSGVNSLGFYFDCTKKITKDDLGKLLKDICLEAIETNFVCSCRNCNCAEAFTEFALSQKVDPDKITGSSPVDPAGIFMLRGVFEEGAEEKAISVLKEQVEKTSVLPHFRTIGIHGKFFGNSGSSVVQELAFSLATGADYLTKLTDSGLSVDSVARKIKFNFSISNNYFLEIAKIRAARLLWSKIVEAYNPSDKNSAQMTIHCETGTFNMTVYDAYVNLLRTQTEAMSAAIGGVQSLTVLPFDYSFEQPTEFAERIARNQQILLKEEAYFDKVTDPAAGSYYIENLTASVTAAAWKLFIEVEEKGGFLAAFREGFIQSQIRETAARKSKNLASRRENLLGTNQFPNTGESLKSDLNPSVFLPCDYSEKNAEAETLKPFRLGQPFEALRYKTDLFTLTHERPVVFLLTFGNVAMRNARALFSRNFFAVGGFNVIENIGFKTATEGVQAARTAKASIIVACSADEEYAGFVPQIASLLEKEILVVAGNPECRPALEASGVTNFIHMKSSILDELNRFQELLGIR
jgi:methylmalonyl-CoA mutase